jgi:Tfp pilus assembly protein PilN
VVHRDRSERSGSGGALFVPLLLLTCGWLVWMGFQTTQLVREGQSLRSLHAQQAQTVDNAQRMRAQLDAIASGTRRLAEAGNENARLVIEQLARQGVTIRADATR